MRRPAAVRIMALNVKSVLCFFVLAGVAPTFAAAVDVAPTLEDIAAYDAAAFERDYWRHHLPHPAVDAPLSKTDPEAPHRISVNADAPAVPPVPRAPSVKPVGPAPGAAKDAEFQRVVRIDLNSGVFSRSPRRKPGPRAESDWIPASARMSEGKSELPNQSSQPEERPRPELSPQLFSFEPIPVPAPTASAPDFEAARVEAADFFEVEAGLRDAFDQAERNDKPDAARALAMFYIANQLHSEGLAALRDGGADMDAGVDGLLAAIAQFGLGRYAETVAILEAEPYARDRVASCWRGMAEAELGAYKAARDGLFAPARDCRLPGWAMFAFYVAKAQTALAAGEPDIAEGALNAARRMADTDAARAEAAWLEARLIAARGDKETARARFERLAAGRAEPFASRAALALLTSDAESGAVAPDQAVERARALGLRWSGGAFEREALFSLMTLENEAGDLGGLFESGRRLLDYHPYTDRTVEARDMMAHALTRLFEEDADISPMQAAEIFYRNIELAPPGHDGDVIIRDVAERLIALDLLGPATELLDHQVFNRLRGEERARVAATLARVYLDGRRPREALRVLRATRFARLDGSVNEERLLLEADALHRTGQGDAALALLEGHGGAQARALAGAVRWDREEWRIAAACFTDALKPALEDGAAFGPTEREWALRAAIAYTLAGEDDALSNLRGAVEDKLGATPARAIFDALAGAEDAGDLSQFLDAYHRLYAEG